MAELKLPEQFESYPEARKHAFLKMKELKESGINIVGVFCTYTPSEMVYAAGAIPVGLCGISDEFIPAAETRLPKNLCPLIKSSYGGALSDRCPFFYFSDMILAETTCDGKRKMYELMGELKHTHVMQLPPSTVGEKSVEYWKAEMERLKTDLEEFFGVEITEEAMREAIKLRNRERKAVLKFFELGTLKPSPLTGYELSTFIDSNEYTFDLEKKIAYLEERTAELRQKYESEYKGKPSRPRILITGCPTGGVRDKVIKRIEELGADVVGFENCCGPREKKDPVDETKEPLLALAEKYLRVNCSVMSPNPGRIIALDEQIDEYQIDGVVEVLLQACHTFAIEADAVMNFVMKEKNIPYMAIHTDYSPSDKGQIDTRLSAFIEMLG